VVHVEGHDTTAVIRLEHGKANVLDTELLRDLRDAIGRVRTSDARAAVLTGTGSIFSAGVDLFRILAGAEAYTSQFIPALTATFVELFEFPLPIVAAVNGHAIAGGCILACACDYRLMSEGKGTIGVPELIVGVEFPTVALEIMRHSVAANELHALIYTGHTCAPGEARDRGLIGEVVPAEQLQSRALEIATRMGQIPGDVFTATKVALRRDALERIHRDTTRDDVLRRWSHPDTRKRIQEYLDRTITRSQQERR
jgi:enoyl-CoA hydratase